MRLFLIFCFIVLLHPHRSAAQSVPVPPSKTERVGKLGERLEAEKAEKEKLEAKAKDIEVDLGSTREKLIDIGRSVQINEKELQELEIRIQELADNKVKITQDLQDDQKSISRLLLALQRIRRVPPQALLARPGAPLATAQSAMVMKDIIPALNNQAAALKFKIQELNTVTADLKAKQQTARDKSEDLKQEQTKLASLLKKREELYSSTQSDLKERQQEVQRISAQADNLKDLVDKLEDNKKRAETRKAVRQAVLTVPEIVMPNSGQARLPISGIIRTRYNQPDNFGAPSQGIEIEGRGGALVVAPMGGIVRFAGFFKNYGQIVILEHKKGYHSLVAGLEKIDTVVGQNISAGEPLGTLHQAGSDKKPLLYYELRKGGRPINPSEKFADLG